MNAAAFVRHVLRTPEAAGPAVPYSQLLAEAQSAVSATRNRLASCGTDDLPGRAIGSLGVLQRATDNLRLVQPPGNSKAHAALIGALRELQEDVADLARRGGAEGAILRSRGLEHAEHALTALAG
jgi:hypothetical protein